MIHDLAEFDGAALASFYRSARKSEELVVVEGAHALKHAERFGAAWVDIRTDDLNGAERFLKDMAGDVAEALITRCHVVRSELFEQLAPTAHQTRLIGIAMRPSVQNLSERLKTQFGPIILLDHPSNLGNAGAVIRLASALGAKAVLMRGPVDPWHPTIVRTAAGLHFALNIARLNDDPFSTPCDRLIALDPEGLPLHQTSLPKNPLLMFGGERHGLSHDLKSRADQSISISMRSGVSSLNLATSAAIVMHEWARQQITS